MTHLKLKKGNTKAPRYINCRGKKKRAISVKKRMPKKGKEKEVPTTDTPPGRPPERPTQKLVLLLTPNSPT